MKPAPATTRIPPTHVSDGNTTLATVDPPASAMQTMAQVEAARDAVRDLMKRVFQDGVHFGEIPGCREKVLLQPGAQTIGMLFNAAPTFEITKTDLERGHRMFEVTCRMTHRGTGQVVGEGVGICSTMENKYRFKKAQRACPRCGQPSLIQTRGGRKPGSWWCVPDKGGCGADFEERDPAVTAQQVGRIETDNPYEYYNTVQKIACKRAFVHAAINLSACSDLFTQDLDDNPEEFQRGRPPYNPAQAASAGAGAPRPAPITPEAGKAYAQATRPNPAPAAASQPAAAPRPASPPPQPNQLLPDTGTKTFRVAAVNTHREGTNPKTGKSYTIWKITTAQGPVFFTFSSTHAQTAEEAAKARHAVEITWETNGYRQAEAKSLSVVQPRETQRIVADAPPAPITEADIPF